MENKETEKYFLDINKKVKLAYGVANRARKLCYDPEDRVAIPLAKNMAERVEGLISVVAPQITNTGMASRINELEKEFGILDWRVALTIAEEIANEKFCKFQNKIEAIEVGIRVGFAYITLGTVASPLEGFVRIKLKKRKDGKDYMAVYYSGPVRSAGGTGASVSVLIADYLRKKIGFDVYDPTEGEIKRMITEVHDYNDRVTNLQYLPSQEEIIFLVKNLPIQIDGDPSEDLEVSKDKDLERIETNRIRNGPCLVICECLAQKAPKLWKQISKWGKDFGLEHWSFLGGFIKIQNRFKSKSLGEEKKDKISPIYTYISDLVAGRPVLTHPLRVGGFRLRYGRSRTSGLSAASIHPATSIILNGYIATGTQLRVERPGKAAAITFCDSIEGPIVKLASGSVVKIGEVKEAKKLKDSVKEILFLGDILFNYGDFYNRDHTLLPSGYCEELWIQELEKEIVNLFGNIDLDKLSSLVEIEKEILDNLSKNPLSYKLKAHLALQLSKRIKVALHPRYSYYWKTISVEELNSLVDWMDKSKVVEENGLVQKIILPLEEKPKRALELLGVPHTVVNNEFILIEKDDAIAFSASFNIPSYGIADIKKTIEENKDKDTLELMNILSGIKIKDKGGIFVGARMGRPEKAKMRKLTGSPHVLFPVGEEGGKLRCFQSALEIGKINAEFFLYKCNKCDKETVFRICEKCGKPTKKIYYCNVCGPIETEKCPKHGKALTFVKKEIDIKRYFDLFLKKLNFQSYPDLIKGVRGTSNKDHIPEHLVKGILRAKHNLCVNKDGTMRYDMTQLPITHFRPIEVGTPIEKLRELGYEKDVFGAELNKEDQLLELKPQDVILPSCDESPDEGASKILFRSSLFIDELLTRLYNLKPFYNLDSEKDLIGHLVIALAPHTSAGIVARIIGFSKTQGFYAHPMLHAATRRDCFFYDSKIVVYDKKEDKISQLEIGKFVESFNPNKEADNYGTLVKEIGDHYTYSLNPKTKKLELSKINEVSIHTPIEIIELILEDGRTLKLTSNHKIFTKGLIKKKANQLKRGDQLVIPYKVDIKEKNIHNLNLFDILRNKNLMVRGVSKEVYNLVKKAGGRKKFRGMYNLKKKELDNYLLRDSFPADLFLKLKLKPKEIGFKRDKISIKSDVKLENDFFYLIGLYVAEGFARKKDSGKGYYQISIAATEKEIRQDIIRVMRKYFGLSPSENHKNHLTFSSRIVHELFINYFKLGSNAHEKNISFFLDLEKEKLSYLLKGYLDGDGSVSEGELRVTLDTVSKPLINNLKFVFSRYSIYVSSRRYKKQPGPRVKQFYVNKGRKIPEFAVTKLKISSKFVSRFKSLIDFKLKRKQNILNKVLKNIKPKYNKIEFDDQFAYPKIIDIKYLKQKTYCLNVEKNHNFLANGVIVHNCDGDEASVTLLLDALINFSRQFLPNTRGATQDAPLVLTSKLIPSEVDDMVFDMDVVWKYPLEFYRASDEYKKPGEVQIEQLSNWLNTEKQYGQFGFTHNTTNINDGVRCSAYKIKPSMEEKLLGQMDLAEKIRAVDAVDVARLVIEKHFLPDIKGNLRKFSMQQFRCVKCNKKYRRPPLVGKCTECGGRIIFTISEGSIIKYLEPAISLAEKYNLPSYLKQTLGLTKRSVEGVFGKEKEKQVALQGFLNS